MAQLCSFHQDNDHVVKKKLFFVQKEKKNAEELKMTFNYKKQNKARRKKDKPVGGNGERERERGKWRKRKGSKSDFAVQW